MEELNTIFSNIYLSRENECYLTILPITIKPLKQAYKYTIF